MKSPRQLEGKLRDQYPYLNW